MDCSAFRCSGFLSAYGTNLYTTIEREGGFAFGKQARRVGSVRGLGALLDVEYLHWVGVLWILRLESTASQL